MAKTPGRATKVTDLRRQVEELLRTTKHDVAVMPVKDVQQLVHELQVYQIELDMQNEELRRTQAELEAARDRYMDLYDFSPAAYLTMDTSGTIMEANLRAGTLFGINRKELIGQPFARFVASDNQDTFHRHCQEVLKTGTRQTCDVQLREEAGASSWVQLESLALHDESGLIIHWRMALLDISARKRAEQAKNLLIRDLSRSQQHFQALFNWTPSAVGIITVAEGRFIDVNEGFSRLTGYRREEVVGCTILELGLWADPSERAMVLREIQEQGNLHNREGRLRTKSGEIRALMVSVEPIQLGATPCLIYLAHDMTDRRRVEEALRLAKFSMDRAADAVYWIDPQGKILDVNEAASRMLGYSKNELCAMTVHDINPEFQPDRWPAFWAETQQRGTLVLETVHRAKDGRLIPVEVSVNYLLYERKEYHCAFVRDITERKRTLDEIRRSQAFIASVVENLPTMIFVKDAKDLKFVRLNKAGEDLLGHSREALMGKSDYDFFPKEEADFFTQKDRQVLEAGGVLDIPEEAIETKHQGLRILHTKKIPIYDDKGDPQYLLGISEDITEYKRAETALRQSETRFRAIFDQTFQFIGLMKTDGTLIEANRSALQFAGIQELDVLGKLFWDTPWWTHSPELQNRLREAVRQAASGTMVRFEATHPSPTGELAYVDFSLKPVRDEHGNVTLLIPEGRNITERKQVEAALRESEERYRSIFENAVDGIFQTTLDGKYVTVNPALVRMYGYDSPEEMITTITDIASQLYVDPGRRDEFIHLMKTQEEVFGFEALVYRKDGTFIWVSENVRTRHDRSGVRVGYEGTVENITERKLSEERLRATLDQVRMISGKLTTVQEAERTRIARELHDELGVRLTCLKIDLSRMHTTTSEGGGARARKKAEDKIRSMIEQIDTTIASVQRLVTELRPAVLDDLGLVAAIEWQCQDFQKRTGIPCTCVTSADDIAMEREQATAIFRICQEALTNTARHAQATAVTIELESRSESLRLVVADNGLGVPDTKVSDRQSLGLLGMRERVALFRGDISIQGHPGKGTTITVCLPRCPS